MPDNHDTRDLLSSTPSSKAPYDNGSTADLLPPDHFDYRLSVDSKLSDFSVPGKEHGALLQHDPYGRLSPSVPNHGGRTPHGPPGEGNGHTGQSRPPLLSRTVTALQRVYSRNKGVLLVALSQLFGALMNLSARLLELEGEGMHPFQVLLARQSLTMLCCITYMWWYSTPGFPFGPKEVRWLLVMRGFSGFFGIVTTS